jgi:high-affinity Fe2+/Pb2+ permease
MSRAHQRPIFTRRRRSRRRRLLAGIVMAVIIVGLLLGVFAACRRASWRQARAFHESTSFVQSASLSSRPWRSAW